jgi:gliding motility-associated-like protein
MGFRDGTSANTANPDKIFANGLLLTTQQITVTLKTVSQSGCIDTAKRVVTIYPKPAAAFSSSVYQGCGPLMVPFTNQSASNFSGSVGMTSLWNFGTGDTSSQPHPVYSFVPNAVKDTVYSVTLTAISEFGCRDTAYNAIRVFPKPTAGFTVSDSMNCGPMNVIFTNTSVPNDTGNITIMSFVWDLANGFSSVLRNPASQFINTGLVDTVYNVRLIGTSEHGCKDTTTRTVTVKPKPVASFTQDKVSDCGPFQVTFTNTSSASDQYNWQFGNGDTSTAMSPSETYQSYPLVDSNYVVKLVTRSAFGCVSDTARKTITARYLPLAGFNTSDDTICNPGSVSFYNTSSGGATNKWQFGNGDSAVSFNPVVSYTGSLTNDTVFMARLIVTTSGMCRDTAYRQIVVNPLPDAQFDAVIPGCTPLPVSFNNTSLRGVSHQWDFGDGTSANTENPDKIFANGLLLTTQQITVTLKTVSQSGCIDTAKRVVTIYPKPAAAFSSSVYQGCGPLMVPFTNQSASNFSGSVGMSSLWNFGTGDTSSQPHPVYSFVPNAVKDTVYSVTLTAISEFGCRDTAYNAIRVFPKPTAGFTVSDSMNCGPMNVIFTNTSVPNDTGNITIMSFVWDLANGFSSVLRNPASQFINTGLVDTVYNVRLIGTSEHGCKDTTTRTVTVKPKPVASFTQDKVSDCGPFQVTFTNTSSASDQYNWQFGNGDTSTLMSPSETYQSYPLVDSNYVVKLVTRSAFGCVSDTARKTITARYLPLAGFYTSADTVCNPSSVSFYNASFGVATNSWQFGNGDSSVAINPIVSYTGALANDTSFTTRLIVTTSGMCRDTAYKTMTVKPAPFASFATIAPGCTPLQRTLANTSVGAVRYEWDFGSGILDTTENPTKEFAGTVPLNNTQYLVTLRAYSSFGCMDTAKQVAVVYPKPIAAFMPNVPEGCGPLPVSFTNQSAANLSGNAGMTFQWRFGNGDTSTQKAPNMVYPVHAAKDTLYTPQLISTSQYGCRDTVTRQIRVFPQPVAQFSTNTTLGCTPLQVNFTNQSIPNDTGTIDMMTFVWNYGNGLTAISKDVVSEFVNTRITDSTFTVQLFATSEHGCKDTTAQNIVVYPRPVASFTQDKTQGCGPFVVNFTNISAISPVSYWLFGDGDSSLATNPSHTYQSYPLIDSFYSASLVTESALGCKSDTVRKTIIGKYIPSAGIVTSSDSTCNPGNISFYNASVGGASNSWNFGNGNTSTAINPVATFNGPLVKDTTYQVRLVVTSPANCRDTTYKVIKVNPVPEAIFASTPPACTPYPVVFNNTSLRAVSYEWEFGDGGLSAIPNPLKIFTNNVALTNRDYTVTLKAYSASGCLDTAKRIVTVFPLPLVNFTASKTLKCDTAEYLIINASQGATGFVWKQNDVQVSNQFAPMVYFPSSYNNDTSYNLKLVGTSISGCKDSVMKPVTIKPLVRAAFSSNGSASCSNINVSFTNETANGMSYFWLFGDGTGSPVTSPQHRYTTTGSYDVKLIAYDAFGCSDTAVKTNSVHVYEVPTANFLYSPPTAALPNSSILFSNLSFISSGNLSHQWIFGDAASSQNSSSLENPSHTFSDSGNFNVVLVVNSIHNCFDTLQQVVRIHPHPPVPAFRLDPPQGCSPLQVQFINQSEYADAYEWTFDDGQTSTDKDPIVVFKYPGKYGAFLRAKGPGGERQLRKDDIVEVFELPRANFFVTPLKMIIPNSTVTLTNISSDGVAWKWRIFSEGKMYFTDSSKNSTFTFNEEGKYDVQLVVRNDKGCLDSLTLPDIVEVNKGGQKFIGNAFTPDGDGINDVFKPVLQGVVSDNYTFEVYNRWGERVFWTHDVNSGWDGTFNGKPAPIDAYVWLIKGYYVGNIDFGAEGNVTLIR